MCAAGHHLSPGAKPYASAFSVDAWKLLKRWPDSIWKESPFMLLDTADPLVRETTRSWQEWHTQTLAVATAAKTTRSGGGFLTDGVLGEITSYAATAYAFCGCPNYLPDEAIAEGNWRNECRMQLTYGCAGGGFELPGAPKERMDWRFAKAAEIAESEIDGIKYHRRDDLGQRVNNYHRPARLGGSTLARNTLPPSQNTSCDFHGWGEYDDDRRWEDDAYCICVILHEWAGGHALGCMHVKQSTNGVMTPGINNAAVNRVRTKLDGVAIDVFNDGDWTELNRRGYKKRTTPPPPKKPEEPTAGVTLSGTIRVSVGGVTLPQEFTLSPIRRI